MLFALSSYIYHNPFSFKLINVLFSLLCTVFLYPLITMPMMDDYLHYLHYVMVRSLPLSG